MSRECASDYRRVKILPRKFFSNKFEFSLGAIFAEIDVLTRNFWLAKSPRFEEWILFRDGNAWSVIRFLRDKCREAVDIRNNVRENARIDFFIEYPTLQFLSAFNLDIACVFPCSFGNRINYQRYIFLQEIKRSGGFPTSISRGSRKFATRYSWVAQEDQ